MSLAVNVYKKAFGFSNQNVVHFEASKHVIEW